MPRKQAPPPWAVTFDSKAKVYRHRVMAGFGHALLAPLVANAFESLTLGVTLWDGREWLPVHTEPRTIARFEFQHGLAGDRFRYNDRYMARCKRAKKPLLGQHAGFCDFFVPLVLGKEVPAILVVGPFSVERPSGAEILERWHRLTSRQGHPADPEFAWYLHETLATPLIAGEKLQALEGMLVCFAKLLAQAGKADELANEAYVLRAELEKTRFVERMWEAARRAIEDVSPREVHDAIYAYDLSRLGVTRMADHVVIGLLLSRAKDVDPVEQFMKRNGFQRACVELATKTGDVVAGQVGDQGIFLLSGSGGSAARKRQKALDLSQRATTLAQRFGLSLHAGVGSVRAAVPLSTSYQAALAAAESAVSQNTRMVMADASEKQQPSSLWRLREELSKTVEEHPEQIAARFESYLEAVAVHSGHRIEIARTHLEVGFEWMARSLLKAGSLDQKSFSAMANLLSSGAAAARTFSDLSSIYRQAALDLSEALRSPVPARQDRQLRGAIEYIQQHYCERLRLERVARAAGFSPSHFSKLFIRREHLPFEKYVIRLRVERARQLLASTDLSVARVAELSGFNSAQYFCRVFRRLTGFAPLEYRQKNPEVREAPRIKVQAQTP